MHGWWNDGSSWWSWALMTTGMVVFWALRVTFLTIGDADRGWRLGAANPQQESASAPDAHGSAVVDHGRETDPTRVITEPWVAGTWRGFRLVRLAQQGACPLPAQAAGPTDRKT